MKNEKKRYDELLQKYYSENKLKKYYGTTEIMEKMGISLRTVRYRISLLKLKYKDIPALMYKEDNIWYIHRQLLSEFIPRTRKTKTPLNKEWETFITWIPIEHYDDEYHHQLASEVKESLPEGNFSYTIEKTKRGVNHTHMVTDLKPTEVGETIAKVINQYLPKSEYRLQVEEVQSSALSRNYFNK